MVDWALAQRVAVRCADPQAVAGLVPLVCAPGPVRRADGAGGGVGQRGHRACTPRTGRPAPRSPTGRAGRRPTSAPSSAWSARRCDELQRKRGAKLGGPVAGGGPGCGRHPARPDAGLHGDAGPRPVRPAHRRLLARGPGPRVLRRSEHRRRRGAVRLRAEPVPPVAGPARGDPPAPVHRRAVAARPLRRPRDRVVGTALGRPVRPRRGAQAGRRRGAGRPQPARATRAWSACWPLPSRSWRCRGSRG